MIKTNCLKYLNGYNEQYKYASDYNLFCMLSLAGKIENLPDHLMEYRKHESQISQYKKIEQDEYAKNIRKNYQVAFTNRCKPHIQEPVSLAEVGIPEIGLAICYYTYAANNQNSDKYKKMADKTIDVIYKITTKEIPVCLENGLCGLGCGFHYLVKNKFLDGDIDEVLEDIDNKVIETLINGSDIEHINDIMFYMNYRISKSDNANSKKIQDLSFLYADLIKKYDKQ